YFMLKDSVPCPIPNSEKDAPARPFSRHDITQAGLPFNRDRSFPTASMFLSCACVAEWPRFEGDGEGIVNRWGRGCPCKPGNRRRMPIRMHGCGASDSDGWVRGLLHSVPLGQAVTISIGVGVPN